MEPNNMAMFKGISLVGGLEHDFYDCPYIGNNHHPNWRSHIFQRSRSVNHQPVINLWFTMKFWGSRQSRMGIARAEYFEALLAPWLRCKSRAWNNGWIWVTGVIIQVEHVITLDFWDFCKVTPSLETARSPSFQHPLTPNTQHLKIPLGFRWI